MSFDDPSIPDHDAIANRARHALHQLAGARAMDSSWADVQKAARRVRQKRLSMLGAAGAIVLVGATAAVAATAGDDGPRVDSIGESPVTTSTSATTSSVPPAFGSSSAAPTSPNGGPIAVPGTAGPTAPVAPTEPAALQPQDGSWSASMSVDATPVIVGDLVTVRAELRNTGTQPQQTNGYGSLAVRCESSILSHSGIWPEEGYPIGQFLEPVVMVPGESRSFSMTFRPEKVPFAGVNCMVGLAFHGDAQNAGPFPGLETDSVAIEIVPAPDGSTTTSTTDTTPTTDTTVP